MPLTFIHAADFHLGADLRRFGPARRRLEEAQFQALDKTLQWAVDEKAAFVVICGDLFDRRQPPPGIIRKTAEILSAYPQMPVYILPGTHDFLGENSVYAHQQHPWTGGNVIILDGALNSPLPIPDTSGHLYFRPNRSNRSTDSPIEGFHRQSEEGFHIGLAHGSLRVGSLNIDQDFPLEPREIAAADLDYLALGHWHKYRVEKYGRTTVAYSGIPQPISWSDPGNGSVLLVKLEDAGESQVLPKPASGVVFEEIRAEICHPSEVRRLMEKSAAANTIVKMILHYTDNFKDTQEVENIINQASSRFLLVQTDGNKADKTPASLNTPDKINEQFIEAFKAELTRMQDADSPERSDLYNKAAELGVAIITGEE